MTRNLWIKFYPDDWNNDLALTSCSLAARGLLAGLLGVLNRSEPYGYLLCGGSPPSPRTMARILGIAPNTYRACLQELLDKGVLKQDEIGIYSARMVRDQQKREEARRYGKRGGNPMLVNPTLNPRDKGGVNPTLNHRVNPTLNLEENKNKNKNKNKKKEDIHDTGIYNTHPNTYNATEAEQHPADDSPNSISSLSSSTMISEFPHIPDEIKKTIEMQWGAGRLTSGLLMDISKAMLGEGYSSEAICEAVKIARTYDKRSWAYVLAILRRWKEDGYDPGERVEIYDSTGNRLIELWDAEQWRNGCQRLRYNREKERWCLLDGA